MLGWLAQAYAQRKRLHAPAALVYKRLRNGDPPAAPYHDHPEQHLPPAYLAAVHLAPASYGTAGDNAEDGSDNGTPGDSEDEEETMPPDPSLLALVNGRSILAAWEQAASRLREALSPASYHAFLEPARLLCWHPPGRLVIAAPTPYARDWLASRLTRLLERGLVGIMAQPVAVIFTTDAEEG